MTGKIVYRVIGAGFAVPLTFVVRRALRAAWRRSRGTEPPRPDVPGTDWGEAVIWATASATAATGSTNGCFLPRVG